MALTELRGKAFGVWYASGCNLAEALRRLAGEGYSVTRQTLAAWRDEDEWLERRTRLDKEYQAARDAEALTEDEMLLASLKRQHEKYEAYFETLEKPDAQATYAHNGLIKTIQEIAQRTAQYKRAIFTEYFKDMLGFFRRNKPDAAAAIETEAESYLAYIREK
jgi:hypothetical protein